MLWLIALCPPKRIVNSEETKAGGFKQLHCQLRLPVLAVRGMTEWPTVRQVARSLRITQSQIEEESGTGDYCTQSYFCNPPQPFGDHEVCAMTPAVDAAWKRYYGQITG